MTNDNAPAPRPSRGDLVAALPDIRRRVDEYMNADVDDVVYTAYAKPTIAVNHIRLLLTLVDMLQRTNYARLCSAVRSAIYDLQSAPAISSYDAEVRMNIARGLIDALIAVESEGEA